MLIAITGGSGFIASHFLSRVRALGVATRIIDTRPPSAPADGSDFRQVDVRDGAALTQALRGADAVLHLAAAHHDSGISREEYFSVNEGGAKALVAALEGNRIESVCNFSTVAVYGTQPCPPDETAEPSPESPYGESKLAAERVLRQWVAADPGRRCLNIRPTVTYGPGNRANMYHLIDHLHRRRFWPIGNGRNRKSTAYVENLADAALHLWPRVDARLVALGKPAPRATGTPAQPFEVFNYVDVPDLSSREIVAACCRSLGRRVPRPALPLWLGVAAAWPFDIVSAVLRRPLAISSKRVRKLATETLFRADRVREWGFAPAVTTTEGLDRMVRWYLLANEQPLAAGAPAPEPAST